MAERVMRAIMIARNNTACMPGIYASHVNTADGTAASPCWGSMGGGADSFYEYLLKLWLITKRDPSFAPYKRAWDLSMATYTDRFLRCSDRGHLYIASGNEAMATNEVEHLACFLGGNLALGDSKYLTAAAGVTESCVAMVRSTRGTGFRAHSRHSRSTQAPPQS